MWIATWALNTLVDKGKTTDWMVHMPGQGVAAHTDAAHGTLIVDGGYKVMDTDGIRAVLQVSL